MTKLTSGQLLEQGNLIALIALEDYKQWFNADESEDKAIIDDINIDLQTKAPLQNAYIQEALANYAELLQNDTEVSYSNYFDTSQALEVIEELFAQQLV